MISPVSFGIGAAAGGALAALVWGCLRWRAGARRTTVDPDRYTSPTGAGMTWDPTYPLPATVSDRPDPLGLGEGHSTVAVTVEQVRLSERVILHLARLGRIDPEAPAAPTRTQQGLVAATGGSQSAVSKVLRQMVASGMVEEERRHIAGVSHRMKAYALSRRGELLAREVAARRDVSLLPTLVPPSPPAYESARRP